MKEFFDTSVLVAAHVKQHTHHALSLAALARATRATSSCAAHSLAEVYAVVTRLPLKPSVTPEQALLFLDDVRERLTVILLDEAGYIDTLRDLAARGIPGGQIYDGLVLRCAASVAAETIYTWNVKHFQRIAPHLADCIRTP